MSNGYYNSSGTPGTGTFAASAPMRSEFGSVEDGFDKLPTLTGNGSKAVVINSGGTALTTTTGALALAGDFSLVGGHSLAINVNVDSTVTFPSSGTLATRAGAETLTNKTISGSSNTLTNIANGSLSNSSVTVNGTSIALGASGTVTAAAGTLTGATLASGVTASSLTSVGTLTDLTVNGAASIGNAALVGVGLTVTSLAAAPVVVYRSAATVNVSVEFRNDTASWFAGQGSTGSFNVNTNSGISSSPKLILTTSGDLSVAGSVLTTASATGAAGLRVPPGTAPSAPTNGDMWTTNAGLFVRINGVTKTVTLT